MGQFRPNNIKFVVGDSLTGLLGVGKGSKILNYKI